MPTAFRSRLRRSLSVAVLAASLVGGVAVAPAFADTLVGTCNVVSNPTPAVHTVCSGQNLAGLSFAGLDLSYANFSYSTLTNADFTGANLFQSNLSGVRADGANFTGANLSSDYYVAGGVNASFASFVGANFTGANLTHVYAPYSNFAGANFTGATLSQTNLGGADLTGANFTTAAAPSADFSSASLSGIIQTGFTFAGANFSNSSVLPPNTTATATSSSGATVYYVSLPFGTLAAPVCTPPSGSTFPVGVSLVSCTLVDTAGGIASGTFGVTVLAAGVVLPPAPVASTPTTEDQCKKYGYRTLIDPATDTFFTNQGRCVSYVQHLINAARKTA